MSRYNNYNSNSNSYYDPVGSQQSQPTGYTYASNTSGAPSYATPASTSYATGPSSAAYQGYGSSTYNDQQQYGSANAGASSRAAATSMTGQEFNQQPTVGTAGQNYDGSAWTAANYGYAGNVQMPSRTQTNTFGRVSAPESTQAAATSYTGQNYQNTSRQTNNTTPSTAGYSADYSAPAQPQQPQRYNSPLHAVQAQGHHNQSSRTSNHHEPSPRMSANVAAQANRQASASVEPQQATTMTVNPSQVYDDTAERRRKAQVEAERRRKREEELAARKAEEDRVAAEKRNVEEEQQKAAEVETTAKKADADKKKAEQRKKAREEKKQSKSAANALQRMASGSTFDAMDEEAPPANAEEAEMRAMFKKMREFNSKNPAMLAKLWEEERKTHASQSPSQASKTPAGPTSALPTATSATPANGAGSVRPFQKPSKATPVKATPSSSKGKTATPRSPATPSIANANTSLWPPHKKGALAESAAKWMNGLPENAGKTVAGAAILAILDKNPSYVQLCEALELLGLRFERSSLARELLKAVPEGMKAQTVPAAPLVNVSGAAAPVNGQPAKKKQGRPKKDALAVAPTTVNYEAPTFTSLSDAAREINSMDRSAGQAPTATMGGPVQPPAPTNAHLAAANAAPPTFFPPDASAHYTRPTSASIPPAEIKPEIKPEEPQRPPANKEEAARKRTFGDLVDLTAEVSDDDDVAPPKKMMFQMPPTQPVAQPQPVPSNGPPGLSQPINANDFYKRLPPPPNSMSAGVPQPAVPWGAMPRAHIPPNVIPTPEMQSLLPPPAPMTKSKGPSLEHKQHERIKGRMLVEPIMRDRVARKNRYDVRSIARDVLLATGRHPDMRGLNSHLNPMLNLLGHHGGSFELDGQRGNRSDLSTIRWDIIDPELTAPAAAETGIKRKNPVATFTDDAADADDEEDVAPTRAVQQSVENGDGTVSYHFVNQPAGQRPKKKIGRPPKVRQSMPGFTTVASGPGRGNVGTPVRQVAPGQQTTPASAPTGQAVGYAAFRQVDENGNVVKKKGRPVGWRKAVHSREAQGLTPPKPGAQRAPYKKDTAAPKPLVEATPQIWHCLWKGCNAQLHNHDTLKKHVVKVHGRANDHRQFECWWQPCHVVGAGKGKGRSADDGVASFADLTGWLAHIDEKHFKPLAWEQGDGPRGGTSDYNAADSDAYLSDAQGRSVTPIIRPFEEMSTVPEAGSRAVPAPLNRAGPSLSRDDKKAKAELDGLVRHKRVVGVVLEKGGSTFANAKRRAGFLDDEDFEDEVESEGVQDEGDGGDEGV
ncbi:hypothetical protein LTR86_001407 [Recurvomyces mirabilis]|nr:hypothetical protein LTR86_001407 [Recurvomyces mirabilis]